MKTLIVFAHPEPQSFGAAMLARSRQQLEAQGDEVQVSDLYAMNFNPVASAADFSERRFANRLQYDREQKHAATHQTFAADIQSEIDKLLWCEQLILQFPLWWFSVPAIMKGWIDRVLVNGIAYGAGGRRFDAGGLSGRRAMLAISTGCYEEMMASDGLLGDVNVNLWHLHAGTLAYCGLQVLPPFIAWAVQYGDGTAQQAYLDAYARHLQQLDQLTPLAFHRLAEFEQWRLRPEIEPRTVAHRRPDADRDRDSHAP